MEWKELQFLVERKIGYGVVQPGASVRNGVPVIKVNNIISGLKDINELDTTTHEIAEKYKRTRLNGGELVISVVGTYGKTAIVPKSFAGCNLVRATCLIDIVDEKLCKWVKYYIDSPKGQAYINGNLNTTVQATLNVKCLNEMPIPFYSQEYMDKAVSILSSLDRKIELNNKLNATLEEMAQALFKSWFVDFEPFKNGNFIDTEIGKIPEGWRVGTLGEVCTTNKRTYRGTIKAPIKYLDTGSVTRNKIEGFQLLDPTIDKIPSRAKRLVQEGDIVYSTVRPNQEHYGFLLDPPFDLVVSTGFCVISAQRSAYRYFIYNVLTQPCVIEKLHTIAEQSVSTYPSINASDIENVEIIIPSDDVIDRFASCTLPFYLRIEKLSQETLTLTHLRDTLLPRLMAGEIEV